MNRRGKAAETGGPQALLKFLGFRTAPVTPIKRRKLGGPNE